MDLDRDAVMPTFLAECEENLGTLEEALLRLDRTRDQGEADEAIAGIFRVAHTLKGNAESLGFDAMSGCAHALESVLDAVRQGAVVVTPALVSVLLDGHDALRTMLSVVTDGGTLDGAPHDDVMQALADAASGSSRAKRVDSGAPALTVEGGSGARPRRTLRVDLTTLDRILTHAGELSIALARLRSGIRGHDESQDALFEVERLFSDLREQTMRLRLVPIGAMLRQQLRGVRDLAAAHGKLARLEVEGEAVEVDAAVLDGLRDPVTHMVRNAVDHALETPEARRLAGKDAVGTIALRARCEAGWVVIDVCDDGAGFNRARILERGRALGLAADTTHLDDNQLLRLVVTPGFSTAQAVTGLSGRGVGMDVVARNVASLKGSITIRSADGQGATVTLRVPLTLAIIDGFVVGVATETYVIPMESVRECFGLAKRGPGEAHERHGIVSMAGEPLPYVRLRSTLGLGQGNPTGESVVVIEREGMRAGIVVDALVGQTQAVVKPLCAGLGRVDGISGSTILGDGRVALILDIQAILRAAGERAQPRA